VIPGTKSADVERFRRAIALRLGLSFEDAKLGFLADVLHRRLGITAQLVDNYLACLEKESGAREIGALAEELTVSETYFFRNRDQYRAFAETALPDRIATRSSSKALRLLSAGCASGEEAYSLAMVIRGAVDSTWDVSILGVDLNPAMVTKATRARYSAWALREMPADAQRRWFKPDGRDFVLDETVRSAVRFETRNLVQDDPQFWQPDSYDVVFFRNVLMYFTLEQQHVVVARVTRALRPGGYLFLGHAETLRGLSSDFHLQHTHETFYYRRKDRLESPARALLEIAPSRGRVPAVVAAVEGTDTWVDAIARASQRIEALTGGAQPAARPWADEPRPAAAPAWNRERALELLREERFTEALELMQHAPPESGRDPDLLLLSAALHTHRGQLAEAEEACRRLLDVDELSAGAHYLLALCREGERDRERAVHHDQVAIYLDPTFAMPHLHLGLLARREGDRATAHRELEQALLLLQREDSSRLLLYGGGFGREALLALCRTELVASGGKP
jgi:chemotaxis protein methyltransferase CheR